MEKQKSKLRKAFEKGIGTGAGLTIGAALVDAFMNSTSPTEIAIKSVFYFPLATTIATGLFRALDRNSPDGPQ